MKQSKYYYDVHDLVDIVGCSPSRAYKLIQQINYELANGDPKIITIRGKVPKIHLERMLGFTLDDYEKEGT